MNAELDRLGAEKYILLTTFRKDGRAVPTPVWAAQDGERLVVWTAMDTGKVKRIRRDGTVEIVPCDRRGKPSGESLLGRAELLDSAETARLTGLIGRKYGMLGKLLIFFSRLRRGDSGTALIGVTLEQPAADVAEASEAEPGTGSAD
ncbi:MAG TPA: PPOX class F420-dependent oxidoreductase [Pseudonocardiaceae bacterium]|jgi:hypothetical protein|nr:PPOX class F420-dependent oxidoreductase [Pseudonocardiaceae bacterium]